MGRAGGEQGAVERLRQHKGASQTAGITVVESG